MVCTALADPGGAAGPPAPPTGSISFVCTYVFAEKCMHRRSASPPTGRRPPPPPNGKSWIRHCTGHEFEKYNNSYGCQDCRCHCSDVDCDLQCGNGTGFTTNGSVGNAGCPTCDWCLQDENKQGSRRA